MPSETAASGPGAKRPVGSRCPRPARENPRQRGLFPLRSSCGVSSRSSLNRPGRAGTHAQRIGPCPRAVRERNRLRWRPDPVVRVDAQAAPRQAARVLRGPIRSRHHLAAEGQHAPVFEGNSASGLETTSPAVSDRAARDTPFTRFGAENGWSALSRSSRRWSAAVVIVRAPRGPADVHPSYFRWPRTQVSRARRVVPGRRPCRLRLVGSRAWSDGHLREGCRE